MAPGETIPFAGLRLLRRTQNHLARERLGRLRYQHGHDVGDIARL